MKALELHCVKITERGNMTDEALVAHKLPPQLDELIVRLHMAKPNWQFDIPVRRYGHTFDHVFIRQDHQKLGYVQWTYLNRRSGQGFNISNHRIAQALERKNSYSTNNTDKAYNKVVKMFGAKSVQELLADAQKKVNETVYENLREKHGNLRYAQATIDKEVQGYVNGPGFQEFLAYVEHRMPEAERVKVLEAINKRDVLLGEHNIIEKVRTAINAGTAVTITRGDGVYLCWKNGSDFMLHTDADVPESWRSGFGMLKLIEKQHYIDNVGCRVDDDTFVLLVNEEK